ncbi:MAG TPA: DUF1254 domain-containing protein [Rhizomicrobium sp.]|jgi:hypothetical protein
MELNLAARDALLYALPMTEIANVRSRFLGAGLPAGHFFPQSGLVTPRDRFVTTPNVDTVYANAFIDLGAGPASLTLPPLGDRYASLSLMDMFSDNFAVLGTRTTGQDGATFTLAGPTVSAAVDAIRSPTRWVWAMARVVVNGPSDVSDALKILHGFGCQGTPGATAAAPGADRNGPWDAWMKAANDLMVENPAPATDRRLLRRLSPLGLGSPTFDPGRFSAAEIAEIEAGFHDGLKCARSVGFGGKQIGGWLYPAANTGNFFQDYLTRARIAVSGLAALPTAEAMYLAAIAPTGPGLFNGDGLWRLHFSANELPPVDAFWSLTMYAAEQDGGLFLAENPINRYTIGDRTPNLVFDADGGLDIWISRGDPGGARSANWLPAPATGPFVPILRTYLPREDLVTQRYTPPPIEKIG